MRYTVISWVISVVTTLVVVAIFGPIGLPAAFAAGCAAGSAGFLIGSRFAREAREKRWGVKVELSADTTAPKKALDDLEKQLRESLNELK